MKKRAIYSCITLQKELEKTIEKIGFEGKVNYLNVHSDPKKMYETLQGIIDKNTEVKRLLSVFPAAARPPAICRQPPAPWLCRVPWTASMFF